MAQRTALYNQHRKNQALMVEFAGFEMPLHYGSQIEEHHYVRRHCGVFDVSHMMVTDIEGTDAQAYLRYLIANDVAKLKPYQALYGVMLNSAAKILDDLIVYELADTQHYRLVTNAGTSQKISTWLKENANHFKVKLNFQQNLAMLAIQGPKTFSELKPIFGDPLIAKISALKPFSCLLEKNWLIARTGYTGEDGIE